MWVEAIKSYRTSIGMILSCRIQILINQQSYTKQNTVKTFIINRFWLSSKSQSQWIMLHKIEFMSLEHDIGLKVTNILIQCSRWHQIKNINWFLFDGSNGYSIKAYKMHCFCWKAPIGLQIVLLPISILSVLYRHVLFSMNKYIAQYMYHK